MSLSKIDGLKVHIVISCFIALLITAPQAMAAQPCAVDPAAGGANILPNVLLIFDNSYSMNLYANVDKTAGGIVIVDYDKDKTYSGIFDPVAHYDYNGGDPAILANAGYFEENAGGAWSGNFLNWVTALRIDVARKVFTGGRTTTSGNTYITANTKVNFVTGYEADDIDYLKYVSVSIVPRPYPYTSSPVTANQVPSTFGTPGATTPYYYTNIGNSGSNQWSRLLVKDTIPSDFDTNHTPVTDDYVYNIRIKVASGNLQGLLDDVQGQIRLGLMHYDTTSSYEGGKIEIYVKKLDSSQLTVIKDKLNRSLGDGWDGGQTTLAETLYEATRFFGQRTPYYTHSPADYTVSQTNDPLYYTEYSPAMYIGCGKNYVILITDGESTRDQNIPVYTPETASLPLAQRIKVRRADNDKASDGTTDCDATACPCSYAGCGYSGLADCVCTKYPFCTVGVDPECNYGGGSAYLDDVAYYAKNNDIRSNITGTQTLTTHTVFAFGTGGGVAEVLLQKTAANGGGQYFRPQDATSLKNNLEQILNIVMNKAAAAASTAITSEPVSGVDLIYIPYYVHPVGDQWFGNIRAFRIGSNGSLLRGDTGTDVAYDTDNDLVLDTPKWDAAIQLESKAGATDSRTIYTYIPGSPTNPYLFTTANAVTIGKYFDADLNIPLDGVKDSLAEEQALINYIRGSDSVGYTVRQRLNPIPPAIPPPTRWYVGDIMHGNPIFVGKPSARYDVIYGDTSYWDFYWTASVQNRTQVLYAPANDGMLHCFDANSGEEKWAYIPYNLLPHLKWLASPDYGTCHTYYLDLTANVWDMKIGSDWKSVLVGGMRLGGTPIGVDTSVPSNGTTDITLRSAIFALDVTNPNSPTVLWEKNDDGISDKFGYTVTKPIPVKVASSWYLVFGSGPKSLKGEGVPLVSEGYSDTNGYIFVINMDPSSGYEMTTISLGTLGAGNFFSSPVAIDYDMDYSVDMIYIGDAKGNLWRLKTFSDSGAKTYQLAADWAIDVSGTTGVADPQPLLSLGTEQPIVVKPTVSMDEKGRVWIYFGTGRYYCASDNDYCGVGNVCPTSGGCTYTDTGSLTRSKYMAVGVYDRHWETDKFVLRGTRLRFDTDPSVLDHRVIKAGTVVGTIGTTDQSGYYIVDASTGQIASSVSTNGWYFHLLADKERSLGDYLVYQGAVFFISFKPDISDPCINNGGLSYLYGVNYMSGTSTTESFFDLTGESTIDSDDLVRDGADRGAALIQLRTGYAGGSLRVTVTGDGIPMGFTPLPDQGLPLNPAGEEYSTGVTSWREVWQ